MTAYELRISDWSSDVCSSDLIDLNSPHAAARWRLLQTPATSAPARTGAFKPAPSRPLAVPRENPLARQAAVAVAHIEEAGQAAHQARLEVVQCAVRLGDFPQLFHYLDPLRRSECVLHLSGEAEHFDGLRPLLS